MATKETREDDKATSKRIRRINAAEREERQASKIHKEKNQAKKPSKGEVQKQMNSMFEHISGKPKPVGKRDGWKSKKYAVEQTHRMKAAAWKAKQAEKKEDDMEAPVAASHKKAVFDDGEDDGAVLAQVLKKYGITKSKPKRIGNLKSLHTSDMLKGLANFDSKIQNLSQEMPAAIDQGLSDFDNQFKDLDQIVNKIVKK